MNLLTLPTDHMLVNLLAILFCAGIVFSCVLRLNVTQALPWRLELVQVMLVCFAFWAAAEMRELWLGSVLTMCEVAAGLGMTAYLVSSSQEWRQREKACGEACESRPQAAVIQIVQPAAPKFPPPPPGWEDFMREERSRAAARHH